jgi:hypothetical protein
MYLDRVRAFLDVAATGNFNRAAERLNVTQSAISARIKTLEEHLDQKLFTRPRNAARRATRSTAISSCRSGPGSGPAESQQGPGPTAPVR